MCIEAFFGWGIVFYMGEFVRVSKELGLISVLRDKNFGQEFAH